MAREGTIPRPRMSLASIRAQNQRLSFGAISLQERTNGCKIMGDVYKEFADESTIHGIKYTAHSKTIYEKLFWVIILVLSIMSATSLAKKFYEKHESGNMRTLVITNQYPSWLVELPAISFCHPALATMHRINQYLDSHKNMSFPVGQTADDFKKNLQYLREAFYPSGQFSGELAMLQRVIDMNNISLTELFQIVSSPCEDIIVLCRYEGEIKPCTELLKRIMTPEGLCCSFNYAFANGERGTVNTKKPITSYFFGDNYILSLLIKQYEENDRVSGGIYGDGIRVIIHERFAYPGPTAQDFVANIGNEVVARLYGRRLTISPDVKSLSPAKRECFVSRSDTDLYRVDNCFVTCLKNKIRKLCGCVPFYAINIVSNDTVCNLNHASCIAEAKVAIGNLSLWDKECNCLPDCEGTSFQVITTTLPFNAPQFNPSPFYQTAMEYPNRTAIHITYAGQSFMLQRRELVLSWINLVSSLGGVFSLFLGCSFISIVEILYFMGYLISKLTCTKRQRNRVHINLK